MAKKKKKVVHRRRRRIGAMALNATSPMVKWGSVALGFLMAKTVNPLIDKITGTLDPKIVGGAQVGLGGMYIMSKGKKNLMMTVVAGVLAGSGLKRAMTAFGIGGYGQVPVLGGYGQVPALGNRRQMNGYSPQGNLGGYSPQGNLGGANVMGSVNSGAASSNGSGSGLMKDGGSCLMG